MIYGDAPSFEVLLKRMEQLNKRFQELIISWYTFRNVDFGFWNFINYWFLIFYKISKSEIVVRIRVIAHGIRSVVITHRIKFVFFVIP
jgi:hypothetical protein